MKNKDEDEALKLILASVEGAIKLLGENLQSQADKSQIQIEGVGFISILRIKETHEIFLNSYKKGVFQKIEENSTTEKKDEKVTPIMNPNVGESGNAFVHDPLGPGGAHDDLAQKNRV